MIEDPSQVLIKFYYLADKWRYSLQYGNYLSIGGDELLDNAKKQAFATAHEIAPNAVHHVKYLGGGRNYAHKSIL